MATELIQAVKGQLTIGRDASCDHRVDHPMVAGKHARLTLREDGFVLEDLGSANGTFLDFATACKTQL